MKYKDRKDAKRKYKQAILTTVATMTLGVSTLGPTASAFAAEGDNISVINHVETKTENSKLLENKWMNKFNAEMTNLKSVGKFTGTTMSEIYKFANKGPEQFNDTLRAITIASTDLIPYGGMFIAPLISAIWPETNGIQSQLNALREDLTKLVTNEIDNEQLNFLNSEFKTLIDLQTDLEHAINADNSQNTDENTKNQRGAWANGIEQSFRRLLDHTSSDKHKITNLPIYTKVALAHLLFLDSLNNKAVSSKMNITEQSLKELYTKDGVKTLANDYVLHIMKTYYDAPQIKKIKQVPEFHFNPDDAENQKKDLKDRLSKVEAENSQWQMNIASAGGFGSVENKEYKFKKAILEDAISSYEFVEKLYNTTVGDPMIKELVEGSGDPRIKELAKDSSEVFVADGPYKIVYSKANKVVNFGSDGIEHPVIGDFHYGKNRERQWWEFKYDADKKAYQIINRADGRVLAYNTTPNADDTALVTENQHKPEHYWILEDAGAGNVLLVNYENKNKVLDVYDEKTDDGSRVYVRDKLNNSNAQKFKLEFLNI
ncbi:MULTISPECIES: insecticidal delta-endotoxin Cry8Ea1 family protein [Bacillus]|uniref:Crystaline entomocidal protoxin n=1 Tax=Bacillus mycoides TaxID=1405 RepID=A0A3D9TSA1_BACMY|nr:MULTISPECIES: insecticidal delta-endotoxin Cry8Ea1 family protein [Bacillus]RBP25772.1 ricin-type beta-trefoil lectin protein [Bacillus sp. DB-2]REF15048.1 ricin-type beta-trefoil lectin protein [Bacillus mycoides]